MRRRASPSSGSRASSERRSCTLRTPAGPSGRLESMSLDILRRVLKEEADAVANLAERLDENFVRAVDTIHKCAGRVITCGVGKSGHVARKTAGTLASTGTPALFMHAAEAVHGDLGMVTAKDIVLV